MEKIYRKKLHLNCENIYNCVKESLQSIEGAIHNLTEDDIFDIKVILNELLSNAVKYGNCYDDNKTVNYKIAVIQNKFIYISVQDQGSGFDISCLAPNTSRQRIETLVEGGRGLEIVKSLCYKIKFNSSGNKISVLLEIEESS